jgi:protein TonB
MERHFGLPIAFAAAAHAALLFGFSKPAPTTIVAPPEDKTLPFVLPPQEVILVAPDQSDTATSTARAQPEPPPVTQPEPIAIEVPTGFVQPVPPPQPFDPNSIARVIPTTLGIQRGEIGAQIGSVVSSVYLDNSPRTRFQVSPLYPFEAKRTGLTGDVIVEFIVDESGRVHDPRVVTSTDRTFEESALRAVAKWIFEPGKRGGKSVRFRMSVPIVFKLSE